MYLYRMKVQFLILCLCFMMNNISFSQKINHWENIVDASDNWKYIIPTQELPMNWNSVEYDDQAWLTGKGGIGYGDGDDNTVIPANTISVFMRKSFSIIDAALLDTAVFLIDYDDGFVAYLNGVEIARANIGTVEIRPAYNATATVIVEPKFNSGGTPVLFPVAREKLISARKTGTNVLSIQVHNQAASSSDLSSTSYFFGGFTNSSTDYRNPPYWYLFSSHLPLVIVDTDGQQISDEPKIDAHIKIINNGHGNLNSTTDQATDYEGIIGIELRGQSSQSYPKKGYGFETRTATFEDSAVSLLNMPKESDWILSPPYADKSLMRNPMTYYLGNKMGTWQPRTQWCELILNGSYQGVYLLVEKIKRDKKRVNIDKILPGNVTGDSLTGGYILKVDKLTNLTSDDYFRTIPTVNFSNARHYDFTYVYPKSDEIVPEQKVYIKNFLTNLESTLNGSNFKDPANGYRKYLDEVSFAEFQIIQELANNVDGYRYSTFFNKERDSDGGKLHAGPLWDFDFCYGNVDYFAPRLATDTWLYTNYGPHEGYGMHWWARLMQDPYYVKLLKERYSQLRISALQTDSIMDYLDSNRSYLSEAIDRNFERWPILDEYVWPNAYIGYTYDNEMDYLKTWLIDRLSFLDSNWLIPLKFEENPTISLELSVYPNPFTSELNFTIPNSVKDEISIEILSIQGQTLYKKSIQIFEVINNEIQLRDLNFNPGIYFIQIKQNGKLIAHSKIICINHN